MKKLIPRRNFLAAMGTVAAAGVLTACGGSSSGTASSAAASSTAASAAESWGDVKLTMWGAEEDQTMLREMADAFIEQNADKGSVTIEIGVQSESSAKDTVLADPDSAEPPAEHRRSPARSAGHRQRRKRLRQTPGQPERYPLRWTQTARRSRWSRCPCPHSAR